MSILNNFFWSPFTRFHIIIEPLIFKLDFTVQSGWKLKEGVNKLIVNIRSLPKLISCYLT
jgi:hypothetical protein